MITIGYLSFEDPYKDRRAWSGLIYKIRESVEGAGVKVKWIPIKENKLLRYPFLAVLKILFGKHCTSTRTAFHCWIASKGIDKNALKDCDYLFCPYYNGQIASYLKDAPKIISYTDCTYEQMIDYYWFNQSKWIIKQGNYCEQRSIDKSYMSIRSAHWATDSILNYYHGDPMKTKVLQFGANIDDKDIMPCSVYTGGTLNVIFSGVDWARKGGDVAVEAVKVLREKGIDARLYLMGIKEVDPAVANLPFVENIGFLNKNIKEQYDLYVNTWAKGHIFLLPTKAECAGVVFCEASAYGLPIFTCDTGGVGDYVVNGENGYRLKLGSNGMDFANRILESIQKNELPSLSIGAKQRYAEDISWKAWSRKFRQIIEADRQNQ